MIVPTRMSQNCLSTPSPVDVHYYGLWVPKQHLT